MRERIKLIDDTYMQGKGPEEPPQEKATGRPTEEAGGTQGTKCEAFPIACCQVGGLRDTDLPPLPYWPLWSHCSTGHRPNSGLGSSLLSCCLLHAHLDLELGTNQ